MIRQAGNFMTALVALAHLGFLMLEMFFWNHPVGQKIFAMTPEYAAESTTLAMNQGLYNGFLAGAITLLLVIAAKPEMRDKTP